MTTQPPAPQDAEGFGTYDAGLLSDYGGGDIGWWQDYLRAELGRAHDFYEAQSLSENQRLTREVERLMAALTPSAETKAAYIGEFSFLTTVRAGTEQVIPWDEVKKIMAAILARAALDPPGGQG